MLKPALYQIIEKQDSYYEFVVAVAQRARGIADDAEREGLLLDENPVKRSVEEFAAGRVKVGDYI